MKIKYIAIILFTYIGLYSVNADKMHLLTDNHTPRIISNINKGKQKALKTGAKLSWVTSSKQACDKGIIKTGSRPNNTNRVLLDGRKGPEGAYQTFGTWTSKAYYANFIVDLNSAYLIKKVAVWSVQTKSIGLQSYELLLSNDGKNYYSAGTVEAPEKTITKKYPPARIELLLKKPAVARYLQFVIKKKGGKNQIIISEVAAWGNYPPAGKGTALLPENQRPAVEFKLTGIGSGAMSLDWSKFAENKEKIKCWKIYRSSKSFNKINEDGVELIERLGAKSTRKVIFPLKPGKSYYYGISAEYQDGEYPLVKCTNYTPPKPFTCRKFGDMLAINHFWGGGGARFKRRPHEKAWEQVALDILGSTPYKQIRWWRSYPEIVNKLYEHNIALCTFPSEQNFKSGPAMGIYSYSVGNEPDISGKPMSVYFNKLKKYYNLAKKLSTDNVISAPTTGLDNHGLKWLDKFYQAGGGKYFDVMDVHSYTKIMKDYKVPPGYPPAAPECLFERVKKLKSIMAKYGDEDKPVISTEYGFTECKVGNPSGKITPKRKAQWLVRGLIIHYVLGFKRVFVYSFFDEGNDPDYTEHAFGLIDYYCQKKPAFYASCTLGRELGNCILVKAQKTPARSNYAYLFKNIENGKYVTVIWDGTGNYNAKFKTRPGKITVTSLMGEKRQFKTTSKGIFKLGIGPSVVYIQSKHPVKFISCAKAEKRINTVGKVSVSPCQKVFIVKGTAGSKISCILKNTTPHSTKVELCLENMSNATEASKKVEIASGKTQEIEFNVPNSNRVLDKYKLAANYNDAVSSYSADCYVFVRRLQKSNGKINCLTAKMYGYDKEVFIISNDKLEVSIDPFRGGRILEIIDKIGGANQVNIDYDRLGNLQNIAFYYCIWDKVKSLYGYGISRNANYSVKKLANGFDLNFKSPKGLEINKQYTLGKSAELTMLVRVINNSQKSLPVTYYLHPEYTVGGSGDNQTDIIMLPIKNETLEIPFWTGLGAKNIAPLTEGWWSVLDKKSNVRLNQQFSLKEFRQPRLWFGRSCYNFEMSSPKDLTLTPKQSWTGKLTWQIIYKK